MHRLRLVLAGFLLAAPLAAQAPSLPAAAELLLEALRAETGSPGLSAAVAIDGKVVWSQGFGEAQVELKVPATSETVYRLGSVSKLLTVAALARLVEEGKLDLDAPVQKYVPTFPDKGTPITPRQLAGHLAGIRHYIGADFARPPKRYERVVDGLEIFAGDPLLHPPGTKYFYTSYGYNLLGAVVEAAAGKSYAEAVDELVIRPLGLAATRLDFGERIVPNRSGFYAKNGEGIANERTIDSSSKWPSAGYLSTVLDLVRFGSAHLADGYLKPETRALLFTSQSTADGKETGVGLGWRIGTSASGLRFYHHGGAIEGGRAFLLLVPDHKLAVAILTNLSRAAFDEDEALGLAELFLDGVRSSG
jgi:CubicO group peptidase (beta-lactamase class C family)